MQTDTIYGFKECRDISSVTYWHVIYCCYCWSTIEYHEILLCSFIGKKRYWSVYPFSSPHIILNDLPNAAFYSWIGFFSFFFWWNRCIGYSVIWVKKRNHLVLGSNYLAPPALMSSGSATVRSLLCYVHYPCVHVSLIDYSIDNSYQD